MRSIKANFQVSSLAQEPPDHTWKEHYLVGLYNNVVRASEDTTTQKEGKLIVNNGLLPSMATEMSCEC